MRKEFHIKSVVDIDRPAATVFGFVADQTNAPRWQHDLVEVRLLTPDIVGVGAQHAFVRRSGGRRVESRKHLVELEDERYVAFQVASRVISGRASYRVKPTGHSTCFLASEARLHASGLAGLVTPLVARRFQARSERDAAALKELLESSGIFGSGDRHAETTRPGPQQER